MENFDIDKNSVTEASASEEELNEAIDSSLAVLPLEQTEQQLITKIIEAPTKDELQQQFELFNINQSKKNALRVIKLNNLLDKVEDQAIERFTKRPDQVSNRELLDYMSIVSNQIDRAQKYVDTLPTQNSPIRINQQKNEVNINVGPTLDRDSKERVVDAITALLKQIKKPESDAKFIEVDPVDNSAEIIYETNVSSEIVYTDDTSIDENKENKE